MQIAVFVLVLMVGILIVLTLAIGEKMDALNQAIANLRAKIDALVIPASNDAAIATATDAVNAASAALDAKVNG